MKLRKRFWGVNAALVIGVLSLISGLSLIAQGQQTNNVEVGFVAICGAIAYKSVKKRRLGLKSPTKKAVVLENACLILIALVMLAGLVEGLLLTDPFAFWFVPMWSFVAYKIAYDGTASP